MERRFTAIEGAPVRAEGEGEERKIAGLAAVYYDGTEATEYELWDGARERIMPGAFDRAIAEDDVRGLFNHNPDYLLARTPKTLTLTSIDAGLQYAMQPADTQMARDVMVNLDAGNLTGSSFAFEITDEAWRKEDDVEIREILGTRLYDVGPVTYPAYEATTAGLRSEDGGEEARRSHDRWRASQGDGGRAARAKRARARVVEIESNG